MCTTAESYFLSVLLFPTSAVKTEKDVTQISDGEKKKDMCKAAFSHQGYLIVNCAMNLW